jgi:hypothetical protein
MDDYYHTVCTAVPRPGPHDELASATHAGCDSLCGAQEIQDALAGLKDMTLQFESKPSGADRSSVTALAKS